MEFEHKQQRGSHPVLDSVILALKKGHMREPLSLSVADNSSKKLKGVNDMYVRQTCSVFVCVCVYVYVCVCVYVCVLGGRQRKELRTRPKTSAPKLWR